MIKQRRGRRGGGAKSSHFLLPPFSLMMVLGARGGVGFIKWGNEGNVAVVYDVKCSCNMHPRYPGWVGGGVGVARRCGHEIKRNGWNLAHYSNDDDETGSSPKVIATRNDRRKMDEYCCKQG